MATSAHVQDLLARNRAAQARSSSSKVHASRPKLIDLMWRSLACRVKGMGDLTNDGSNAALFRAYRDDDDFNRLIELKAVTDPATTVDATWASPLVKTTLVEFITQLEPISLAGALFNGTGALMFTKPQGALGRVPGRDASSPLAGAFIGETEAIPLRQALFSSVTLLPHKIGVISTFTEEMLKSSGVDLEQVLRLLILEDTADALDAVLVDNVAASSIRPAGLANGAVVVTPAPAGADSATTDIGALINAIQPATRIGLIAHPSQAFSISSLFLGEMPILVSLYPTTALAEGTVLAVDLDSIAASADLPQFLTSFETLVHEETAPTDISTPGTPNVVAAPSRSLWQTQCAAVQTTWWITWVKRRTNCTAIVTGTNW